MKNNNDKIHILVAFLTVYFRRKWHNLYGQISQSNWEETHQGGKSQRLYCMQFRACQNRENSRASFMRLRHANVKTPSAYVVWRRLALTCVPMITFGRSDLINRCCDVHYAIEFDFRRSSCVHYIVVEFRRTKIKPGMHSLLRSFYCYSCIHRQCTASSNWRELAAFCIMAACQFAFAAINVPHVQQARLLPVRSSIHPSVTFGFRSSICSANAVVGLTQVGLHG